MGTKAARFDIWRSNSVRVEPFGEFVKLTAPCGESRRVAPETAREIAAKLTAAAEVAEQWREFSRRPAVAEALEKLAATEGGAKTE